MEVRASCVMVLSILLIILEESQGAATKERKGNNRSNTSIEHVHAGRTVVRRLKTVQAISFLII